MRSLIVALLLAGCTAAPADQAAASETPGTPVANASVSERFEASLVGETTSVAVGCEDGPGTALRTHGFEVPEQVDDTPVSLAGASMRLVKGPSHLQGTAELRDNGTVLAATPGDAVFFDEEVDLPLLPGGRYEVVVRGCVAAAGDYHVYIEGTLAGQPS